MKNEFIYAEYIPMPYDKMGVLDEDFSPLTIQPSSFLIIIGALIGWIVGFTLTYFIIGAIWGF